jgi:hypothetical protein
MGGGRGGEGGGGGGDLLSPALLPLVLALLRDTEGRVLPPLDLAAQPSVGPLQLDHRLVEGGGGVRGCGVGGGGGGMVRGGWHGKGL